MKTKSQKKYAQYLKSEHWQKLRKKIIRQRRKCELCGSIENLQVHHQSYARVGKEKDRDLALLCRGCHKLVHSTGKTTLKAAKKILKKRHKRRVKLTLCTMYEMIQKMGLLRAANYFRKQESLPPLTKKHKANLWLIKQTIILSKTDKGQEKNEPF